MDIKNIQIVSDSLLCTGCGICSIICPQDAIQMKKDETFGVYKSIVNLEKCKSCGLCLSSCPPLTWSNEDRKNGRYNIYVGNFLKIFSGYSLDEKIRFNAASGGFITTLLIYLLENSYVDGVILTKRSTKDPIYSFPFIAKSKKEILEGMGSKYSPVKFDEVLKELRESDLSNIAVVGLPCHIEAISNIKDKRIIKKIKFKICILCGQNTNFLAYDYLMKIFNLKKSNLVNIKNRGHGWPGFMELKTTDKIIKVPYTSNYSMGMILSSPVFTPFACHMCVEPVGFRADITCSDAWLKKYTNNDRIGRNLVLVKNSKILEILNEMTNKHLLSLNEETLEDFLKANENVFINKLKYAPLKLKFFLVNKKIKKIFFSKMKFDNNINLLESIKIYIFMLHINFIKKIGIKNIYKFLNFPILFYFKILNLLKKGKYNGK